MKRNRQAFEAMLAEENLIARAQGLIVDAMQRSGVNQRELARRLEVSEAAVSKMLGEETNLSMRRFARVMHALDDKASVSSEKFEKRRLQRALTESVKKHESKWDFPELRVCGLAEHAFEHANENDAPAHEECALEAVTYARFSRVASGRQLARAFS